jgi:hypothetical protein
VRSTIIIEAPRQASSDTRCPFTSIENGASVRAIFTRGNFYRAYRIINETRAGGPAGTSFNVTHTYDPVGNPFAVNNGTTITTYTCSLAPEGPAAAVRSVASWRQYNMDKWPSHPCARRVRRYA